MYYFICIIVGALIGGLVVYYSNIFKYRPGTGKICTQIFRIKYSNRLALADVFKGKRYGNSIVKTQTDAVFARVKKIKTMEIGDGIKGYEYTMEYWEK